MSHTEQSVSTVIPADGQDPLAPPRTSSHALASMTGMIVRSTDDVEPRHRLDYWVAAMSQSLFRLSSSISDAAVFSGRITAAPLGDLHLVQTVGSERNSFRSASSLSEASGHSFHLVGDFHSDMHVEWRGKMIHLKRGDLFFGDTRFVQSGHRLTSTVYIRIPPTWTHAWMRNADQFSGRRIDSASGWGAALSSFVAQLTPQTAMRGPLPSKLLSDSLGALMALVEGECLDAPPVGSSKHGGLARRIEDLVRQRASEFGLTSEDVASSLGISERELHRCLCEQGKTFFNVLTQSRVDSARRMLASRNLKRLTTAEIGRRAGFSDPSYFIRTIARHLGMTPRKYRLANDGAWPSVPDPCGPPGSG